MRKLYYILITLLVTISIYAQQPLTDRIIIEFMKPGDKDAEARNYNLVPWPEEAKAAAYKAAEIWASYLEITVPIRVKFGWCDNLDAYARGGSTYSYQYTDGYNYPLPLINQLLGYDKNQNVVDIICVFNSDVNWYFGLEKQQQWEPDPINIGAMRSKNSIIPTMLHEICHGLGITSSMNVKDNIGNWGGSISGKARIYDKFLCNKQEDMLIDERYYKNNSEALATVLTSEEVFWNGTNATAANGGDLVKIHAPKEWSTSSISHIAAEYGRTINDLMAYGTGGVTSNNMWDNMYTFTPGPIVLGMLQDIGWTVNSNPTANETILLTSSVNVYASAGYIHIHNANIGDLISIYEISGRAVYNGKRTSDMMEIPAHCTGVCIVKVGQESFKVKLEGM